MLSQAVRFCWRIYPLSSLHTPRRQSLNHILLCERKQDDRRDQRNDRAGCHLAPFDVVLEDRAVEADRNGLEGILVDEHDGKEQLVPGVDEIEYERCCDARFHERNDDPDQSTQVAAAIDPGSLLEGLGHAVVEPAECHDRERNRHVGVEHRQHHNVIEQLMVRQHLVQRRQHDECRDHLGNEKQHHQQVLSLEVKMRENIPSADTNYTGNGRCQRRGEQ